jgi:thioredoxin reductase (NADPH)
MGARANPDWLADTVALNDDGFVLTGSRRRAELARSKPPGVFAVGDVRAGSATRVASAVGEGAARSCSYINA